MGVHRPPPRFHAALGYVATADFVFGGAGLAVALGLTFAPHTHVRPLTPAEIHTTGAPPVAVTTDAVSTVVAVDGGKNGPEPTTASRACRCEPRQPVVSVQPPSVTTPPLTALSAPVTASSPSVGVPVTPTHTTQGSQGDSAGNATPTVTLSTTPQTTTTAAESTTDDPDGTTAATSSEETP